MIVTLGPSTWGIYGTFKLPFAARRNAVVSEIVAGKEVPAQDVERRISDAKQKTRIGRGAKAAKRPDSPEISKARAFAGTYAKTVMEDSEIASRAAAAAAKLARVHLNAEFSKFKALIEKADLGEFVRLVCR